MRYGLIVCLVLVCLAMLVGCQEQESKAVEYQWQLSSGEAIALAQDDFDDWLSEIDCRGGRRFVTSILCPGSMSWTATKGACTQTFGAFLAESRNPSNVWCVKHGQLSWCVYDESQIVNLISPSWSAMETYKQLGISRCD